jgi:H+/Cl- antiporter ClcA
MADSTSPRSAMMTAAGSFTAISTLFGSPLLGAFLIMETAGIGGVALSMVVLPGRLASGIGALVFVGLGNWTGLGTFSLALQSVPPETEPTVASLAWALVIGALGAGLAWLIRSLALRLRPIVHLNRVLVTAALGLLIGLIAIAYQLISGRSFTDVLFSGQDALPDFIGHATEYSVGLVILVLLCKALAYALSLSAFRGGPVFPSIFLGAAIGMAISALPGASLAPAIASGIGGMCAAMLRLPLTSTLLAVVLLGTDGLVVTPQVVVAVAVSFVIINLLPDPGPKTPESQPAAAQPTGAT